MIPRAESTDRRARALLALEALPRRGFLVWIDYAHGDVTWCVGTADELTLFAPGSEGAPAPDTNVSLEEAEACAADVREQLRGSGPPHTVRVMDLATREDAVTANDLQLGLFGGGAR